MGTSYGSYKDSGTNSGANFSDDNRFRYRLWRTWDEGKNPLVFIGLNPSTADAVKDDPTVHRMGMRARAMGAGGLVVLNIFAFRATDPKDMKRAIEPVGFFNDDQIVQDINNAKMVLIGWGNHGEYRGRGKEVLKILEESGVTPYCFGKTKSGHPRHPLYISYETKPEKFS